MKKVCCLFILFFPCIVGFQNQQAIHIFMVGDSTMANKKDPDKNPEFGWGQVLQTFFSDDVQVNNHAVNGRSSKSFIEEGRWDKVIEAVKSGDYVFIQFGHNDAKVHDKSRYTNPHTTYRKNLIKFIQETKAKGAFPILLSSIVRRKFNEQDVLIDTHGAYPLICRLTAQEFDVPFIDLQLKTEELVQSLGDEASKSLYLWLEAGASEYKPEGKQDDTHLNKNGALKVASLTIEGLKEINSPLIAFLKE